MDENEILLGRASNVIKVYDSENREYTSNLLAVDEVPVIGIARYDGYVCNYGIIILNFQYNKFK